MCTTWGIYYLQIAETRSVQSRCVSLDPTPELSWSESDMPEALLRGHGRWQCHRSCTAGLLAMAETQGHGHGMGMVWVWVCLNHVQIQFRSVDSESTKDHLSVLGDVK